MRKLGRALPNRRKKAKAGTAETRSAIVTQSDGPRYWDSGTEAGGRHGHFAANIECLPTNMEVHASAIQDRNGALGIPGKPPELCSTVELDWTHFRHERETLRNG